jgi:hypothetical protein
VDCAQRRIKGAFFFVLTGCVRDLRLVSSRSESDNRTFEVSTCRPTLPVSKDRHGSGLETAHSKRITGAAARCQETFGLGSADCQRQEPVSVCTTISPYNPSALISSQFSAPRQSHHIHRMALFRSVADLPEIKQCCEVMTLPAGSWLTDSSRAEHNDVRHHPSFSLCP